MTRLATALLALLLISSARADLIGDEVRIDWYYPDLNTSLTSTTLVVPGSGSLSSFAPVSVGDGWLTVTMTGNGFGSSTFNGFILTDLTKVANFTSFSLLGDPFLIAPELSFGANFLQVNFTPGGQNNVLRTGGPGTVLEFRFTTADAVANVPERASTLLIVGIGLTIAAFLARRVRRVRR